MWVRSWGGDTTLMRDAFTGVSANGTGSLLFAGTTYAQGEMWYTVIVPKAPTSLSAVGLSRTGYAFAAFYFTTDASGIPNGTSLNVINGVAAAGVAAWPGQPGAVLAGTFPDSRSLGAIYRLSSVPIIASSLPRFPPCVSPDSNLMIYGRKSSRRGGRRQLLPGSGRGWVRRGHPAVRCSTRRAAAAAAVRVASVPFPVALRLPVAVAVTEPLHLAAILHFSLLHVASTPGLFLSVAVAANVPAATHPVPAAAADPAIAVCSRVFPAAAAASDFPAPAPDLPVPTPAVAVAAVARPAVAGAAAPAAAALPEPAAAAPALPAAAHHLRRHYRAAPLAL